jgi:SAM-dependent methyltransferase
LGANIVNLGNYFAGLMNQKNDVLGDALSAFYKGDKQNKLWVYSDQTEKDEMPLSYFFRNYDAMPDLEKMALNKCKGKVLDVGAGAGSNALWLQEQGIDVFALDSSSGSINVMKSRGIIQVIESDFLSLHNQKFDTILMLMNGVGLSKDLEHLPRFLAQIKKLLNIGGQLLFDSTDLKYLYADDDGSMLIDLNGPYYGEIIFQYSYKNEMSPRFKWLYIDDYLMEEYANKAGFAMDVLYRDESDNYLARLTLRD